MEMLSMFEMTPDLVCIAGLDGFFRNVNPAVIKTFGYTREELLSQPVFSFLHPDDRERTGREREKLLNGETLVNLQNRYCTKDGAIVWLEWTSVYIPAKQVVFAIAKNITARKLVEQEIEAKYEKFKSLTAHFKNSIETDRKVLAIELHEELAQLASVLKLHIEFIGGEIPVSNETLKSRMNHALSATTLLVNTIRRISFSISPNMLDDMGLHEVMEWFCAEFSTLNGIPCYYESTINEALLPAELQLDVFRICQEALTNALCHTSARKIVISIREAGNNIQITIADDGRGFEVHNEKQVPGFTRIRKRVASIHGHLVVDTEHNKGTRISVTIGLPNFPQKASGYPDFY